MALFVAGLVFFVLLVLLVKSSDQKPDVPQKLQEIVRNTRDQDWTVRRDAIADLARELTERTPYSLSLVTPPIIKALSDRDWHVRSVALAVIVDNFDMIQTGEYSSTPVLSEAEKRRAVQVCRRLIKDEQATIRLDALRILNKSEDTQAIPALAAALTDPSEGVCALALTSLQRLLPHISGVVFKNPNSRIPLSIKDELINFEAADLTIGMPNLKSVEVDLRRSDLRKVEQFGRYMDTVLGADFLGKQVTLTFSGDPFRVSAQTRAIWSRCKAVESDVAVVIFGALTPEEAAGQTVLVNPDFATCPLPLNNLRHVFIEPATADFHILERFLTYGASVLGQQWMRKSIEVVVVGDLNALHANLKNALTNLCKNVTVGSAGIDG